VFKDFWYMIRSLASSRTYALTIIITLALGIGANIAVFLIGDTIFFRPLSYKNDQQLVMLWSPHKGGAAQPQDLVDSYPDFLDWQRRSKTLAGMAAFNIATADFTDGQGEPENVPGAVVTSNFFDVLGVKPIVGSGLETTENGVAREQSLVLSYSLWQRRFGGNKRIIGAKVHVSGGLYTVVGVMPETFRHPEPFWEGKAEFWVGMPPAIAKLPRDSRFLRVVGRMKHGATIDAVQAELSSIARQLAGEFPASNTDRSIQVVSIRKQLLGDLYLPVKFLVLAAILLLLIACANVANLQLARTINRSRQLLLRIALGASRYSLILWICGESLLLSLGAGALGLLIALAARQVMILAGPKQLTIVDVNGLDLATITFAATLVFCISIATAVIPVIHMLALNPSAALNTVVGQHGPSQWQRVRGYLVASQIAFVVPLTIIAFSLARGFYHLSHIDPGFVARDLITFRYSLPQKRYPDAIRNRQFASDLETRVGSIQGVRSIALISGLPLTTLNTLFLHAFSVVGQDIHSSAYYRVITPGYFRVMGIPKIAGRDFDESDGLSSRVAIVNQAFADNYLEGRAIGKFLMIQGSTDLAEKVTVIGVVRDLHYNGLMIQPGPEMYIPYTQDPMSDMAVVVQTKLSQSSVVPALRRSVYQIDPLLPITDIRSMDEILADNARNLRFATMVMSICSGLSLVLGLVGVGGMVSYIVAARRRDLGVRLALGAQVSDLIGYIVRSTMRFCIAGALLGSMLAFGADHFAGRLIYGLRDLDLLSITAALAVVVLTSLIAAYLPSRSVMEIEPLSSLRAE